MRCNYLRPLTQSKIIFGARGGMYDADKQRSGGTAVRGCNRVLDNAVENLWL